MWSFQISVYVFLILHYKNAEAAFKHCNKSPFTILRKKNVAHYLFESVIVCLIVYVYSYRLEN